MINRGDIKLAIDMVVNAQDDNLFGGEAEYVINTLEDCGNTIAAQAAVIERLTKRLASTNIIIEVVCAIHPDSACAEYELAENMNALAIPTDSTQILDEVRRAEREKCADVCESIYTNGDGAEGWLEIAANRIRAME